MDYQNTGGSALYSNGTDCNTLQAYEKQILMAERQGFEPWIPFRVYTLSKRAPSATRPSLRWVSLQKRPIPRAGIGAPQGAISRRSSIVAYRATAAKPAYSRSDPRNPALLVFFQLLRQVVRDSHLADGVQLPFQPIDVVLFVVENFLRQVARAIIARSRTHLDALIQALYGIVFELKVVLELRLDSRADVDLEVVRHVRSAVKIQNALHQLLGVGHFLDGFLLDQLRQAFIAPVFTHLGVKKVLVDCRQLRLQELVEKLDDFSITFHMTSHDSVSKHHPAQA